MKWKVDQKWNDVKLESVQTLLKCTCITSRKSYLIIIGPNVYEKLTNNDIRSSLFAPICI